MGRFFILTKLTNQHFSLRWSDTLRPPTNTLSPEKAKVSWTQCQPSRSLLSTRKANTNQQEFKIVQVNDGDDGSVSTVL